jgi:hypothetical protein
MDTIEHRYTALMLRNLIKSLGYIYAIMVVS